jgi:hypothetical protein
MYLPLPHRLVGGELLNQAAMGAHPKTIPCSFPMSLRDASPSYGKISA